MRNARTHTDTQAHKNLHARLNPVFTQMYGGMRTFFQMVGCGTLEASAVWTQEINDAEAEIAQEVKAAQEAKTARDAKGPGKGRKGTGDVSASVPKPKKRRVEEPINGVEGSRRLPHSKKSMLIAVDECRLPTREEFFECAFRTRDASAKYARLKDPTDEDFPKRVKRQSWAGSPESLHIARAREFNALLARANPEMSGVLPRTRCPPERSAMPRKGYDAQSSHNPGLIRVYKARALLKRMEEELYAGNRPEMIYTDYMAFGLWGSLQRARKRAAEEMVVSDVSAEAAQDASGAGSSGQSWGGRGRDWRASGGNWEEGWHKGSGGNWQWRRGNWSR